MQNMNDGSSSRVLANAHGVAERLAIWSEEARRAQRIARADCLLLAAWHAFDLPSLTDSRIGAPQHLSETRLAGCMAMNRRSGMAIHSPPSGSDV